MKVSFTCMNTYDDPEALSRVFTATPRALWDPERGKRAVRDALALAGLADQAGFDYVSVSEHHYQAGMCNPNPALTAAALTRVVEKAGIALLGPLVSMNNPVRIAEELAMLDQLSGGRLIAMPLRGTPNEFVNYNVSADETRGRTEQAMLLIKRALSEPEPFSWKSEYYDFPVVSVWPGPTQVPHMPLYSSANSPDSGSFAAKNGFGAGCSYFGPKRVAQLMEHYRQECAAAGWTPRPDQMLYRAFCVVGRDPAHADSLVARFRGDAPPPGPGSRPDDRVASGPQRPGGSPQEDAGFAFGFLQFHGDPDALVAQIREFHELTGVGILDLSFNFGYYSFEETAEQIATFGSKVLPRIRSLATVGA